jgi:hypothetical protein
LLAARQHASANAAVIITGRRSPLTRFIGKFAWKVRGSGARHTRSTGSSIARTTHSRWNKIVYDNAGGTKNAGW